MDKLWAPWRVTYVTQVARKKKGCVFCHILKEKKDKKHFIIKRTKHAFSVLNIYPYNNGHVMIIPNRHVADLSDLSRTEREGLMDLLQETKVLLDKTMHADGYNIGINLGKTAGAGFPKHVHIHMVPRWQGDVNFMPVTGNTKVISQSLEALYQHLSKARKALRK
ncbi:MAG TPA: HIT domain-containing protein [Candidatus Omnitrophota bacterium]|nr:HIT domain-containing protein [Candidatus Omnitrophota bacterium]